MTDQKRNRRRQYTAARQRGAPWSQNIDVMTTVLELISSIKLEGQSLSLHRRRNKLI